MSTTFEKLEHNMAKLTIEVSEEKFADAMQRAYQKMKGRINVPGFRKGKAPRQIIEKMYGPAVFYEEAANFAIQDTYEEESKSTALDIVSRPSIDIEQIEAGKAFIYTAEVALKPDATVKKYKGLEIEKRDATVTDEEVEAEVARELEKNARLVDIDDRPAKQGDTVTIDFEGFVDDVPFEGGKGEDYALELGSNTFIPGFEDQLVGHSVDEDVDVHVRFPDDYGAEELKGKEALFKCKIHKIAEKQMPEADDEFAKDVSEFDTLAEYKEDLKKTLTEEKEERVRNQKENDAVAALIAELEADIPDAMIDTDVENMERDYAMQVAQQGMPLETYLQYMGMTPETFRVTLRPQALNSIKSRLALEKVAELEKIEISEEAYEKQLEEDAKRYNMELDKLKEIMDEESEAQMKKDMAIREAVKFITENAVEVEKKEEPKEEKEEAAE